MSAVAKIRSLLWISHRWIALILAVLLIPISLSGALLILKGPIEVALHPARYAVTGATVSQPISAYLSNAQAAVGAGRVLGLQFPDDVGRPVTVTAREQRERGRARTMTVYLDPATARVLEVVDFRSSLIGLLHRFHENLTIPEYSGRSVAGWVGIGMLILSFSGLWLWWPRNGAFLPGLRWKRGPATTYNLHHLLGFWISLPLALVSATGVYLAFPPAARSLMASIAPMSGQSQRALPLGGQPIAQPALTPERALTAARALQPGAEPVALFLAATAGGGERRGGQPTTAPSAFWRIQLRSPADSGLVTVRVDDRSGVAERLPDPLAGDRAAQWIRWLHEGSNAGPVWRVVAFLTGAFPPIFAITGVVMWLRGRRQRKLIARTRVQAPELQAAE